VHTRRTQIEDAKPYSWGDYESLRIEALRSVLTAKSPVCLDGVDFGKHGCPWHYMRWFQPERLQPGASGPVGLRMCNCYKAALCSRPARSALRCAQCIEVSCAGRVC
jgi:hypothetical protein